MDKAMIWNILLAVCGYYKAADFIGEIIRETKPTDLFGENQWHTLGAGLIKVELEESFSIDIPEKEFFECQTMGDLADLVDRAMRDQEISVELCMAQGPVPGGNISQQP